MRRYLLTSLVTVGLALAVGHAGAQEYPVQKEKMVVEEKDSGPSDGTVAQGEDVRIAGGGFAPGADVTITLNSDPMVLGTTTADAAGNIDTTVRIPDNAPEGTHTLQAAGAAPGGGTNVLSQVVEVVETESPAPAAPAQSGGGIGGVLPRTGAGLGAMALLGIGTVAAGTALVARARRRHS